MAAIDDLDEETAFTLIAAHVLRQVELGKMNVTPFHLDELW